MTLNGKRFTVTREMLIAVARDQRWPVVVAEISARFSKFAFVLFFYITNHLMTGPLGSSEFCFPARISMFPETKSFSFSPRRRFVFQTEISGKYIVLVLISRLFYFLSSLRRGDQSTVFCIVSIGRKAVLSDVKTAFKCTLALTRPPARVTLRPSKQP